MSGATGSALRIEERGGRVRFNVHVQPRASRDEVVGVHGDALKVRLTAPPVEGAANEALVKVLAKAFAVDRRAVNIVAGRASRAKVVEIEGITGAHVRRIAAGGASP